MNRLKNSKLFTDPESQLDLRNLLEKKIEKLDQYLEITKCLGSKIDSGEAREILPLLDQRQDLIEEIIELDHRIQTNQYKLKKDSESQSRSKNEILKLNYKLLKEIEELDQRCIMILTQKLNRIKNQLSEIHNKFKAVGFYSRYPFAPPRFLDIKR